jgi:hypothetical protein
MHAGQRRLVHDRENMLNSLGSDDMRSNDVKMNAQSTVSILRLRRAA